MPFFNYRGNLIYSSDLGARLSSLSFSSDSVSRITDHSKSARILLLYFPDFSAVFYTLCKSFIYLKNQASRVYSDIHTYKMGMAVMTYNGFSVPYFHISLTEWAYCRCSRDIYCIPFRRISFFEDLLNPADYCLYQSHHLFSLQ